MRWCCEASCAAAGCSGWGLLRRRCVAVGAMLCVQLNCRECSSCQQFSFTCSSAAPAPPPPPPHFLLALPQVRQTLQGQQIPRNLVNDHPNPPVSVLRCRDAWWG